MKISDILGFKCNGLEAIEAKLNGNLIWKSEEENLIEFNESIFPTEWAKTDTGYSATNEYGEWKVSATATGDGNASRAFDTSSTTYWQSPELSASTESQYLTIECPVLIRPKKVFVESGSNGSASAVHGYTGSSWSTIGSLTASSSNTIINSKETTIDYSYDLFFTKFRVMVRRYNSSNNEPRIYDFKITSGYIKK